MTSRFLVLTRWAHYIAGVMWIGHLWFFNFVNSNLQADAKYPADMKKVINPLLMTRALFFFRWGAMFTLITGLMLLGLLWHDVQRWTATPQGAYMAMGVIFGFIMWRNVWFIIWPRQKKIIAARPRAALPWIRPWPQAGRHGQQDQHLPVGAPDPGHDCAAATTTYMLPGGHLGLGVGVLLGLFVVYLAYKFAPKVDTQIYKG